MMIGKNAIITIISLLIFTWNTKAQTIKFEYEIPLAFDLSLAAIDKENYLYLASEDGNLYKYSSTGDSLLSYSPGKKGEITYIDAARSLRIFIFYRDFQEYAFLDRFLRPSPLYSFNQELIDFAGLATLSNDEKLWVLDLADLSLKKYDIKLKSVELNTPLNRIVPTLDYESSFLKEYNNQIFLIDAVSGIYVFDNMGNYSRGIQIPGIKNPCFIGNQLFFIDDSKLFMMEIHSGSRVLLEIPTYPMHRADLIIVSNRKIYLFEKNRILIYTRV